jgi:nucleoid DNA-binding protein/nucleoid-associated protein YgaU
MNVKTTPKEILEQFVQKSGLTEMQSSTFFDAFQNIFSQAIEKDRSVKISGLGTFQLVWNKPRKSVDIRTKQEIEIAGHYKLNFTPDNVLKERVNAPFAHLKAMEVIKTEQKDKPIEKLARQAVEIKDILVDIQQDNNRIEKTGNENTEEKVEVIEIVEKKLAEEVESNVRVAEIQDVEVEKTVEEIRIIDEPEKEVENTKIENEPDEKELAQKQSASEFFNQKLATPIEVNANTFVYAENYYDEDDLEPQKQRCWLVWIITLLAIAVLLGAFYYFYPDAAKKYLNSATEKITQLTEKAGSWLTKTQADEIQADMPAIDTVEVNSDTVSEPIVEPEISVFDLPRNYSQSIAEVILNQGNTLVKLSEKYYGNKVFWVYIYEANSSEIANPDNVPAGQVIKIPKMNEKLIDVQNPLCLEYVKKLHNRYVVK